jgi:ring-1,2-phenylacetyl-CoA epoxidase subunit PaaE
MLQSVASVLATIVGDWTSAPEPSFELRTPSRRWSRFADGRKRRTLRVVEVVRETPSTSTLFLEPLDGRPLEYLPGQHLTLLVEIDGVAHRRCYSFSSAPSDRPAVTIKHIPDGRVSGFLTQNIQAGQMLRAAEPSGAFTVTPDPEAERRFVMIAGGVGITPLVCMTEAILRGEPRSRVVLLYGNRMEEEIIFRERIAALAAEFPHAVEVVLALDHPPKGWRGAAGPLSGEKVLELLRGVDRGSRHLVCGPRPMMESVTAALAEAGVADENIRLERFEYVARGAVERPATSFRVSFARSGKEIRTVPGEPILTTALAAGVSLDFSCQMGGCGACKLRTSAGAVVMDQPNCLTTQEIAAGFILPCCAYAADDVVIEGR